MRPLNKREGKKKKKPFGAAQGWGRETWIFLVGYLGCLAHQVEPVAAPIKKKKCQGDPPKQEDAIIWTNLG